jgi:hypothetical protein
MTQKLIFKLVHFFFKVSISGFEYEISGTFLVNFLRNVTSHQEWKMFVYLVVVDCYFFYYFKSDHHGLNRIGWIYIYHNQCNLWLSMLKLWVWFPSVAKPYGYQTLEYEFCTCTRRKQPIRMLHRTDAMFWLADYWLILEKKNYDIYDVRSDMYKQLYVIELFSDIR